MRRIVVFVSLSLAVAGCGTRASIAPAANIGGDAVSQASVQRYVSYAAGFYASGSHAPTGTKAPDCAARSHACDQLHQEALYRLLQQQIVLRYARRHHIALSKSDRLLVAQQLTSLRMPGTTTAALVQRKFISPSFLRSLLTTEILVQKVEAHVVGARADRGYEYHLRTFYLVTPHPAGRKRIYRQAIALATNGKPIPNGAFSKTAWLARFRLTRSVRQQVTLASPGQFVGPFRTPGAYLVIQVLARGDHRFARAARDARATRLFREWLRREMKSAHTRCFNARGSSIPCPSGG